MELRYYNLVVKAVEEYFKAFGVNYTPKDNKHDTPLNDYFYVEMKTVKAVKRVIIKSDRVKSKILDARFAEALAVIEGKIQSGENINFHLSKRILSPRWHDWLLNEWMINHVHISNWKKSPKQKFFDSSKWLLFVAFNDNQAIFIDIREHNEPFVFAKLDYLETMLRNWPEIMEKYHMKHWGDLSPILDDEGRDIIRRKGYYIGAVKIGGKIYRHPGAGSASAGNSFKGLLNADDTFEYLHEIGEYITNNKQSIIDAIEKQTGTALRDLDLKIVIMSERPYFRYFEKTVGRVLDFNNA